MRASFLPLPSASDLKAKFSLEPLMEKAIRQHRQAFENIISGQSNRFVVVVGPCSIHDREAMLDYAKRLKKVAQTMESKLLIILRAYIQKPRSSVGWKGYLYDVDLKNQSNLAKGLEHSRLLLRELASEGLPLAMEFLDPFTLTYFEDLITWGAIGARTAESQTHRELASQLAFPVGFKNTTAGDVEAAVEGVYSAGHPHESFGVNELGQLSWVKSQGNPGAHVVLRGSKNQENYSETEIQKALNLLAKKQLPQKLMIDCSHGNSQKQSINQLEVLEAVLSMSFFKKSVFGVMLESFLEEGNQPLHQFPLQYGMSITDPCLSFSQTEAALEKIWAAVQKK